MGIAAYNRGSTVIANQITASGSVCVNHPPAEPLKPIEKAFAIGDTVYCRVRGLRGKPEIITAVKRGYIKVKGFSAWCPVSNFQRDITI